MIAKLAKEEIMGWEARTNSVEVGLGTRLNVLLSPQVEGEPPATLTAGVNLSIINVHEKWISATVLSAARTEAVVAMPDGKKWKITPVQYGEIDSGIKTDMTSQDWAIRSEAL
jgi:hypothetical protein